MRLAGGALLGWGGRLRRGAAISKSRADFAPANEFRLRTRSSLVRPKAVTDFEIATPVRVAPITKVATQAEGRGRFRDHRSPRGRAARPARLVPTCSASETSVGPRKVACVVNDGLGLFDDPEEDDLFGGRSDAYAQDGPDLFGAMPDELILPTEPVAADDPEVDVEFDTMDEIPVDPDDDQPDDAAAAPDAGADDVEPDDVEPDEAEPDEAEDDAGGAGPQADSGPTRTAATASSPTKTSEASVTPPVVVEEPKERRPDAPLALYRRYRPETFAEVIGQEHVTVPLQRALENNRVNHAYLFSGPRGCGKTTSARILARCLNCVNGPTSQPCGVCQSCRDLARGGTGSIDVIEIDAASHGGVDEARDLRERAFFAPVHSRYKIYIIDEAHMVTNAGFNALLKVVEEPPPHVKFIFATTEPEKVIGTIRSRTHHYPFRLVPPRTLGGYLAQVCESEGVTVESSVLPLVVRAGAGSVRDSLSVLDQLLGGAAASGVSYAQATALLGYTPDSLLDQMMDAFAAGDAHGVFAAIDRVLEVGQDPRRFAEDLLRRLRDLIIVAAVPDALATGLVDVAGDQAERLTTQASGMGRGELTRAAEVLAKGLTDMRGTTAPRLHLELMCARVLLPGADVDVRGVHARLDRLERRLHMAAAGEGIPDAGAAVRPRPDAVPVSAEPAEQASPPSRQVHPVESATASSTDTAPSGPGAGRPSRGSEPDSAGSRQGTGPASEHSATPADPAAPGVSGRDSAGGAAPTADITSGRSRPASDDPGALASVHQLRPADDAPLASVHELHPVPDEPPFDPWFDDVSPTPHPAAPASAQGRGGVRPDAEPSVVGSAPVPGRGDGSDVSPASSGRGRPDSRPVASGSAPASSPTPGAPAASDPGTVSTADVRAMWPQVLDAVKNRRRVTWIVLRENAQVTEYANDVLTLALANPGARDSFSRGSSEELLREALREVLGIAPRIEVIAGDGPPDPSARSIQAVGAPGWSSPSAPAAPAAGDQDAQGGGRHPAPEPVGSRSSEPLGGGASPETSAAMSGAALARQNIEATRVGPVEDEDDETTESRDDADLDGALDTDELLTTVLGAELIAEEDPTP